ncbi:MAG: hypothetical protein JWQ21_2297 [Herminiimonas sp.]|nr:hypothetical protein [Herminiimonas sp.]
MAGCQYSAKNSDRCSACLNNDKTAVSVMSESEKYQVPGRSGQAGYRDSRARSEGGRKRSRRLPRCVGNRAKKQLSPRSQNYPGCADTIGYRVESRNDLHDRWSSAHSLFVSAKTKAARSPPRLRLQATWPERQPHCRSPLHFSTADCAPATRDRLPPRSRS